MCKISDIEERQQADTTLILRSHAVSRVQDGAVTLLLSTVPLKGKRLGGQSLALHLQSVTEPLLIWVYDNKLRDRDCTGELKFLLCRLWLGVKAAANKM